MATARPFPPHSASPLHHAEETAFLAGKVLLGSVATLIGVVMSLTLFLIPIGVPLTLLGISLLLSEGNETKTH